MPLAQFIRVGEHFFDELFGFLCLLRKKSIQSMHAGRDLGHQMTGSKPGALPFAQSSQDDQVSDCRLELYVLCVGRLP